MRRRRLTMLVAGVLMIVGSSLSLEPARASGATSIDASGWWWKLQTNGDVLVPGPATVAAGQLHVEGTPVDGATAIAAVAATLAPGEAKPILTLKVAANGDTGGEGAVLLACQAGSAWTSGDAQPWPNKPNPACNPGGVAGQRSADGTRWTFDLTALQFDDQINVVLTPGTVDELAEGANGSAFSLTFEKPTADAIQTRLGDPPPPPTTLPPPIGTGGGTPPADSGSFDFTPPVDSGGVVLPPVEAALPDAEQGLTPVAPSVQDQSPLLPASVPVDPRSPHARSVGILLLLLGAGVVYATTRQQPVIGPEGIPGGLGRWVSPRWGSPPSLRG
jgi:hypothetical protein